MKKCKRFLVPLTGDKKDFADKMKRLYGSGDYESISEKYVSDNRRKILVFTILFVAVSFVVFSNDSYGDALIYDKEKNLVSIQGEKLKGKTIELQAYVKGYDDEKLHNISLYINSSNINDETEEEKSLYQNGNDIKSRLLLAGREAVDKQGGGIITLPKSLEGIGQIVWHEKKNNNLLLIFLFFVLIVLYLKGTKLDNFRKDERKALDSIDENLPEFINKLVLLLEAGALFTSAVYKISDKHKTVLRKEENYFALQLDKICSISREQKRPLQGELLDFAMRTGKKEFIRIAGIIYSNTEKGTDLVEKLKIENTLLWNEKKRNIEEKGMLAESKMVVPMAMLLIVLVIVTVAPAMLEM